MTANAAERTEHIIDVFLTEFGELMKADPNAFHRKFRKMAASPFAFYRGSACLFYSDVKNDDSTFLDEKTSRVWMHGDLHAENFGTYMNANGVLVFNVNDFDEAYVGPFTWDLKRFAASVALIGYAKALSDDDITQLVTAFARSYLAELRLIAAHGDDAIGELTLDTSDGELRGVLQKARLGSRLHLLNKQTEIVDYERKFMLGGGAYPVDEAQRAKVRDAFAQYLTTLPASRHQRPTELQIKDFALRKGVGIGSAGLPSYNVLLEGNSQALENDIIVYMKQAQVPAVSRVIDDERITKYFRHQGHRTAESQHALQSYADPWCGYTELDGVGQFCAEVSPYAADLDWSNLDEPEEMAPVVAYLGRAVARMHSVADDDSEHGLVNYSTEDAIAAAIGDDDAGFTSLLVDFAHRYGQRARADHQLFVDLFRNDRLPTEG
ncbi:DUF2252 domain-containing protein [Stackebrandtia nassauensis]|uniref:DUF2252 domain-containing protein n=1 Tax=Stackebrandtia nassauensis (strain DSM 44728 / CIP 108903 / NRRL B-16338 / NBRC 102104 / LLR-40K-21) TaxID=446470 RepID=D3Q068_STANL|nr:DUF2252 domain-containing protein [Stackebrandtia nassauensis]ADD45597.1 conserved hypothetical protein [Stackebrandtia nassauensis DSM 44728]